MDYAEINKKLWDAKTDIHVDSEFYDLKSFMDGSDSLNSIELALLGDVKGKSILHLQCHFGQDSLSLARHGAKVTGVDISSKAIQKAQELNKELGLDARFIESDVLKLSDVLNEQFDVVFASYGTIGWLPDMTAWAAMIQRHLKKGGQLVFVEFHPIIWMMSYDFSRFEFEYDSSTPIVEELEGTYTDPESSIKEKSVSWNHGMTKVLDSLIKAGLKLENLQEYDYSPYNCFQNTVKIDDRKYRIKGLEQIIPMVYSVVATK